MSSYDRDRCLRQAEELRNSNSLPFPNEFSATLQEGREVLRYASISEEKRQELLDPLRIAYLWITDKIDMIGVHERNAEMYESTRITSEDINKTT
ncbi:MAG: hypothetical protein Q8P15_00910 [Nanoarchaeota archaeon]|nr:hypothetical protein [Nanoarchaeota archaeon]